jgi:uncharacterized protein
MSERILVFDRVGVMDRTNFYAPGEIGKTRRLTPEGFMVCEGVAIARIGQQRYHKSELPLDADGSGEITVDRPAEEVFSAKTIASFEGKPVTVEHPNEFVTPDSWKTHAVGTVQNVRQGTGIEDDMLIADLLITDGEAIAYVNRKHPELSCGYDAEYDQAEPGHAIQRNIIGNHVALVDRGRAGPRCAIRDSTWDFLDAENHGITHHGFDPGEKRDKEGKWTTGNRNSKASAEEAALNVQYAAIQKEIHEAMAKGTGGVTALLNRRQRLLVEIDAHLAKKKAAFAKAKSKSKTTGDKSMKSRFADKFIRVMQAFSAKDAVALDRELATDDHTSDAIDETMDGRIRDALDWIDEQRTAQLDAAAADAKAKKEKEEEDCEMEKKKAKDAQAAKDSAAALEAARVRDVGVLNVTDAAQVFKHIFSRAEILSPGIAIPTGDSASAKDALPALMLKAVQTAYATEAGKAVIEPFLMGEKIEAVTVDNVSGVFTGAAELMRERNNRNGGNTKLTVKDFGKAPPTAASLNETNRKFWATRSGG